MVFSGHAGRCVAGFGQTYANQLLTRYVRRATAPIRDIHVVEFITDMGELKHGAGHQKLDVVRMSGNRKGDF